MAIIVPVLESVMASMQTTKTELDTSSIPLHLYIRKGVRPNGPASSRANFFNHSLNFFPPRIDRPIKPTPIRSSVDGSEADDIITPSAKAVSGRSNKTHNSNEAI
jgi:hypothetical protein